MHNKLCINARTTHMQKIEVYEDERGEEMGGMEHEYRRNMRQLNNALVSVNDAVERMFDVDIDGDGVVRYDHENSRVICARPYSKMERKCYIDSKAETRSAQVSYIHAYLYVYSIAFS